MGSQVIGEDRSRFPGRGAVGEVRGRGSRVSERTKERVHRFRIRLGREKRASRLPCFILGLGDDRRSASRGGDVNLAIFTTPANGSESLASFTNRFFYFSVPPGFRMGFIAAERNERFGLILCRRSKENSSRGKRKRLVFLCRRIVGVKVEGKVIPTSFLKIEGWKTLVGRKDRRERQLEELVGDQTSNPEAPPRSKRGGSKGDIRGGATARGAMEKCRYARVIEGKEVRREDPIEYFLPTWVGSTF